jgi:putative transposase
MPHVSKTFTYKLVPTADQERVLLRAKSLCNWLYNTALEQRITAWTYHRVSLTWYQQHAEQLAIKDAFPAFAEGHSLALQDVLVRLDRTYQAFFRRVQAGETAGFPRFQGANRYHSFTIRQWPPTG